MPMATGLLNSAPFSARPDLSLRHDAANGKLYVANSDAIVAFPYSEGDTQITAAPEKIADLPGGPINHHWTKDVIASVDGTKLYATVGSNSNVGENGIEAEENRAAILEIDITTRAVRVFASGLRNPNGLSWQPDSGELWVAVNERDEIGSDLVPDYMTSVKDGGFYGWPYSYYGQHGSWNRNPHSGYKVVFIPFAAGKPAGNPKDILTGFISADDKAMGRPVGVAIDKAGALLVADDVGNTIWRVAP
jgi:glucose/arabinose dehydrogenase